MAAMMRRVQRLAAGIAIALISPAIAQAQDAAKVEPGEKILNAACLECHDHRHVDTQALDEAGWTKAVQAEIARGAKVSADDRPVLIDYLVRHHGPVPEGPGREILLNVCTQCHDLTRIQRQGRTPEGWLEILDAMLNEGAPLSEQDLPVILRYLARNFKP
jgi:hypothetical protein